MGNKRRRIALSCVDCRRRKVKCDRTYPSCIRCVKAGHADKCNYVSHVGPGDPALPTPSEESLQNHGGEDSDENEGDDHHRGTRETSWVEDAARRVDIAQHIEDKAKARARFRSATRAGIPTDTSISNINGRLIELETYVRSAGAPPISTEMGYGMGHPTGPGYLAERNPMSDKYVMSETEKVLMRGKAFKTQYFGPSHGLSILLQFEELSKFVKSILLALPLSAAKQSMVRIREVNRKTEKELCHHDLDTLISMVPEREFTDRLLQHYFDLFECTYRVLHIPSFIKQYKEFWGSPNSSKSDFVVQLLLAISTVYCSVPGGPKGYIGRSSARRETASRWIACCQSWLDAQSQKHVELAHYQTHILLFLTRRVNCIKIKREWTTSGYLVRLAMAAGMHREPGLLCKKITPFDSEMRRRIWHTIVELDLQASIDRGMTPTITALEWDTVPPSNIDDEEFELLSESIPASRPHSQFTRTSFLHTSADHLGLRMEVLARVNSIRTSMELDTIMQYDEKIRCVIDNIPNWETDDALPIGDDANRLIETPSKMSRLMLYEYILILHQPFATQASMKSAHFFSRAARRDASMISLQLYANSSEIERSLLSNLRDDYVRAALCLAQDLAVSSTSFPTHLHPPDHKALDLLTMVVSTLETRTHDLGQGFHCYWITSSTLSFVHSKQSPQVPEKTFVQAAADRVQDLHQHIINGQVSVSKEMLIDPENTSAERTGDHNLPKASGSGLPTTAVDDTLPYSAQDNGAIDPTSFGAVDQLDDAMMLGLDSFDFDYSNLWNYDPFPEMRLF